MLIWHWGDTTRKIIIILLCATLIVNFFGFIIPNTASGFITHNPIYIDGNADFTPANGVTGGSGTQSDPYIIEGWDIRASSTIGIYIRNTDAYFIIGNCNVYDGWRYHDGIYLRNVRNGRIENTVILNNDLGIHLRYSYNNNILNTTISSNCWGIWLSYSSYNNISNNSISSNRGDGISLISSNHNNISNNSVSSNSIEGIRLWHSSNNNIFNNDISNNDAGICLDFHGSSYNNIYNNNISNNLYGIYLYYSSDNTIRNNSILGNVLSALYSRYSADIDARYNYFGSSDQKQIEKLVDCDYDVDYSNWLSYRESNVQYINTTLVWNGTVVLDKGVIVNGDLSIGDATVIFENFHGQNFIQVNGNLRILNSTVRSNYGSYTILYLNKSNGSVINSDLKGQKGLSVQSEEGISVQMSNLNSGYYGIVINKGKNVVITNCNILNNGYGIFIYRSSCNDIYKNDILYHYRGIYLLDSSNNNIFNNNILTNYNGIYVFDSSNNNIFNNAVNSNSYTGIFILFASFNNNVYNNEISNNDEGIYLYAGYNNIYNNIISSNYYDGIWCQSVGSIIRNNEINDNFVGIAGVFADCVVEGNTLSNNFWGIIVVYGRNNEFFHNNFIGNTIQACDNSYICQWDDGYPSGGNYWSDYTGIDEKSGPNQDQPGSDGIGDTPYNISGGTNKDRYPLIYSWGTPRISVEKEFIPSEIMTISQGVMSSINITNIGDVNITSMTIIDEYVENMRPNDPAELLVTISSDKGEAYAIMLEDLNITSTDSNITISFELPLEVVPIFWENGTLQFGEELYYLESIPKDWIVRVQYLLYPITELEIGTHTADATVTAYSEVGESTTEIATGTLTVSEPIELR